MHHPAPRTLEVIAAIFACLLAASCRSDTRAETETHFLRLCDGDCSDGLSCLCGVCTEPCASDAECAPRAATATCAATSSCVSGASANVCDVECASAEDCRSLGTGYDCLAGRCRGAATGVVDAGMPPGAGQGGAGAGSGGTGAGAGGASGAGGVAGSASGAGGAGAGGSGGAMAGAGGSGGSAAGAGGSAGSGTGGAMAGTGGAGQGGVGGAAGGCDTVGATCCDPFPGDGVNYCDGGLTCVADNTCADCNCAVTGGPVVCGVDGGEYIAACGEACLPVAVACQGPCPCECVADLATGCASTEPNGGAPCCDGLLCCEGVPYDPAGECRANCPFLSDRALKTDVRPADTEAVLDAVASLPIAEWRYRSEPDARHLGPMAQDFAAALGLGADERTIAPVDASGVALASIQALNAQVRELVRQNAALHERLRQLEAASANACR